jgi:hypothetical protein
MVASGNMICIKNPYFPKVPLTAPVATKKALRKQGLKQDARSIPGGKFSIFNYYSFSFPGFIIL